MVSVGVCDTGQEMVALLCKVASIIDNSMSVSVEICEVDLSKLNGLIEQAVKAESLGLTSDILTNHSPGFPRS